MKIVKDVTVRYTRYGYYDEHDYFIYHREDGPALICSDGEMHWYINDRLHREDGPAVINDSYGIEDWYHYDKNITDGVTQWLEDHNIDNWQSMTDEDKLALSFYMRSL